jgi:2-methylaconitate cis-trans-isomerase PrpF
MLETISRGFPKVFMTNGDEKNMPMNAKGMPRSNQKFQSMKERIRMAMATRMGAFVRKKKKALCLLVPKTSLASESKRVSNWACPLLCASRNSE